MKNKSISISFRELKTLGWLLWRDLIALKESIKSDLLDNILWPVKTIILFAYIMPGLGLPSNYDKVILIGTVVTAIFFNIFRNVNQILIDSEQNKTLFYQLVLPISTNYIFLRNILIYSLRSLILGSIVYIVGSIIIPGPVSLMPFSITKTLFIFLLINLVFASGTLLIAGLIKSKSIYHSYFATILFSLWDFGCYFYTWHILYLAIPIMAYLVLLNPITYTMEGLRSAALGPKNYINFWLSALAIFIIFILFTYFAVKKLKEKFDTI